MLLFCPQNPTRYITQVFVKHFSLQKSTIIWMCLELVHTRYSTTLIAPINVSDIPLACHWTWLLPKELMESFGVSYCLLWSTTTLTSTKEATLHTTFLSRYKGVKRRQTLVISCACRFSVALSGTRTTGQVLFVCLIFQTPCLSSPCQNGGTCVPNYKYHTFECNCKEGFVGEYCKGK